MTVAGSGACTAGTNWGASMIETSRRSVSGDGVLCDAAETQARPPTCRMSSKTKMLTWDWRGGLSDEEYTERGQTLSP